MKSWKIVIPAVLLICSAVVAQAATASNGPEMKGHWVIGVQGGVGVPTGKLAAKFSDDGADMKMGFGGGALVDYYVTDQIGIGVDGSYDGMKAKDDLAPGVTLKATTMQFGLHGKWLIPAGGKMLPYLNVGAGMYNRKIKIDGGSFPDGATEVTDTKPGVNGGVGLDYLVTPQVGIGANIAYHMAIGKLEKDVNGDGIKDELLKDWSYIPINVAVTFHIAPKK